VSINLPNPYDVARAEAARITSNPVATEKQIERVLIDMPYADRAAIQAGVERFHRERMAKIPSATAYPEAQPWVDHALVVDREVQALTGFSDLQMAMYRSLYSYLAFRGFASLQTAPSGPPASPEKCRIAYLPETEQGRLHIKNVDDPLTFWKPRPPVTEMPKKGPLYFDGVGSGLHIDDEPAEIFPLPVRVMLPHYAGDVPGGVEFLTRYSSFWGRANLLLHDEQKRSAAIEKTSFNFIEVPDPLPNGCNYISGMVCRRPDSPQGQYVAAKRRQALQLFNKPDDCSDAAYWSSAFVYEEKLAGFLNRPSTPSVDETIDFFTTPAPDGLNKWGSKFHPEQPVLQYTLLTEAALLDRTQYLRWQRDESGVYPAEPEVYQF